MIEQLNREVSEYKAKWENLIMHVNQPGYFSALKPTALGWKVKNSADFDQRYAALRDKCDQIHLGWVNERWIATMHLTQPLEWEISVVKIMQRRPQSTDATGLDHVDFYAPDASAVLQNELSLQWHPEMNGDYCKWLSILFDGTEAKLRSDTVVQVCVNEMQDVHDTILK